MICVSASVQGIFWGQIRNFVIDMTGAYKKVMMSGLHYQVSQATSLQYVEFKASTESDAEQRAICKCSPGFSWFVYDVFHVPDDHASHTVAENGSGGHMSDLTFTGGKFGICKSHLPERDVPNNNMAPELELTVHDLTQTVATNSSPVRDLLSPMSAPLSNSSGTGAGHGSLFSSMDLPQPSSSSRRMDRMASAVRSLLIR